MERNSMDVGDRFQLKALGLPLLFVTVMVQTGDAQFNCRNSWAWLSTHLNNLKRKIFGREWARYTGTSRPEVDFCRQSNAKLSLLQQARLANTCRKWKITHGKSSSVRWRNRKQQKRATGTDVCIGSFPGS